MKNDITLIFPMAGQGARFGYKFKPFLEFEGKGEFIKEAFKTFQNHLKYFNKIIFVYLESQEKEYNVSLNLNRIFSDIKFEVCLLEKPTNGPGETVKAVLAKSGISGPIIVCDCDHSLNIDEFMERIQSTDMECLLPVWSLAEENIKSWSIVSIIKGGQVAGIAEKELPTTPGEFFGVIGCYYLKDSKPILSGSYKNISDYVKQILKQKGSVEAIRIREASFFGDPERLKKTLKLAQLSGTIFCDLDGTIIHHEDKPSTDGIILIKGSLEKIIEWKSKGYYIVLTTARNPANRKYLEEELSRNAIIYDELIMGLPSGHRVLINDRKPSDILNPSAIAYEIKRNSGIKEIDIERNQIKILERMKGGSFADTLLIELNGSKFIRKIASKRVDIDLGYLKLKKQFYQLSRFKSFYSPIIPTLINEQENSLDYFFDMQYLEGYKLLSDCDERMQFKASERLLEILANKIYLQSARLKKNNSWLKEHLENKIFSKTKPGIYQNKLDKILEHDNIVIDGNQYLNINQQINFLYENFYEILSPKNLCPIHGDLTFENILCQEEFGLDVKLIDMDGSEYLDALELDMGKMFQSIITRYEKWSKMNTQLVSSKKNELTLNFEFELVNNYIKDFVKLWSNVLCEDEKLTLIKAYFYTSLHLIRMIRFRLKVSEDQAIFALLSAIRLLQESNKLLLNKNA